MIMIKFLQHLIHHGNKPLLLHVKIRKIIAPLTNHANGILQTSRGTFLHTLMMTVQPIHKMFIPHKRRHAASQFVKERSVHGEDRIDHLRPVYHNVNIGRIERPGLFHEAQCAKVLDGVEEDVAIIGIVAYARNQFVHVGPHATIRWFVRVQQYLGFVLMRVLEVDEVVIIAMTGEFGLFEERVAEGVDHRFQEEFVIGDVALDGVFDDVYRFVACQCRVSIVRGIWRVGQMRWNLRLRQLHGPISKRIHRP